MKNTFVLLAVAALIATPCFARSLGLPNELVNGSWATGDATGWIMNGGGITNAAPGYPGPASGEGDPFVYGASCNWTIGDGQISQDVYVVVPGEYEVDLSGWLKAFDTGGFSTWIELQLTIDDVVVASRRLEASGQDLPWTYEEIHWQGWVNEKKDVHIVFHVDGREDKIGFGNAWGWAWADGIDLEERYIPEPASLVLLAMGGLALVRRRCQVRAIR